MDIILPYQSTVCARDATCFLIYHLFFCLSFIKKISASDCFYIVPGAHYQERDSPILGLTISTVAKVSILRLPFPRNKQRVSYVTNHNVRFYYAIFFAFVAVIMVTAFRGKSGSKNRHFCDCADGRMYLTITLLVMGS